MSGREAQVEAVAEAIKYAIWEHHTRDCEFNEFLARAAIAALPDRFEEGRRAGLAEALGYLRNWIEGEESK